MKKLIPLIIILFVLGIGGMTGLMFWSDHVIRSEEEAALTEREAEEADSSGDESDDEQVDEVQADAPERAPEPKSTVERRRSDAEVRAMRSYFSQVFASMPPEDAAEIFRHMNDAAVREALANIPARTAAAILSHMPHERSAKLSDVYFSTDAEGEEGLQ